MIKGFQKYCLLIITMLLVQQSFAQKYTEYELKSAFIYNFTKFIQWPTNNYSTFKIVIVRNNDIKIVLNEILKDKKINNKKPELIYIDDITKISDCQILFIEDVSNSELITILEQTKNKACLTIANHIPLFCQKGGIINFTPKYYNYRFEINNLQAEWKGLKISSKLLILSKVISPNENKF